MRIRHVHVALALLAAAGCSESRSQPNAPDKPSATAAGSNGADGPLFAARVLAEPKSIAEAAVRGSWPRFLGPGHDGKATDTHLLKEFAPDGPTLVWEMETGSGYAPPAVVGNKLVFIHRIGNEEVVECLHAETGARNWSYRYPTSYRDRYGFGNGPRCGPAIDEKRVFTFGAEGKLHAFDIDTGDVVWHRDIASEYKIPQGFFGVASTPLVEGELLFVNVGAPGGPCVVASDKRTGKEIWRAGDQWGPSYASPIPATTCGKRRVFVLAGGDSRPPTGGLMAIDPTTGAVDFSFPFRSTKYESVNAASPVIADNRVFISSSYNTGGACLELKPDGGYELAWKSDALRCHFATPIHVDGYLYGFDGMSKADTGIACVDLKTGKQVWRIQPSWTETLETSSGPREVELGVYRGSMIYADGRFLSLGEMGHLLWLDLSPEGYNELSRARLFYANETWTPLVLARGLLYVTQNSKDTLTGKAPRLLCYDLRSR